MKARSQEKNIGLLDIVDLKFLQEFQDAFAKSTNVACIIIDNIKPVTKPSNFTDFCIKYTKGSELGYKRCNECDIKWGKLAAEKGEPIIYSCHSGLTDFAVPIMLDGKHIGSILGGQVLTSEPNEEYYRKIANELGINEDEYITALKKIRIIPFEQVKAAADLLFVVANSISEMANKNFEPTKKRQRDELLNKTTELLIRSSFNIEKFLDVIVYEIANIFNVDRVAVVEFKDKTNFKNHTIIKEYKKYKNIKSPLETINYQKNGMLIANYILNSGEHFIINNINETSFDKSVIDFYKSLDIKSLVWIPIMSTKKELWGFITLSTTKNKKNWSKEDISLLNLISNQIYIAINQTELFNENKQIAENEKTLRRVMLSSSSTFNFEQIINSIVSEAGKLFNADRCFFIGIDTATNTNLPIQSYAQYLSSPSIKSHLEVTPKKSETGTFVNQSLLQKVIYVENINDIKLPEDTRHMLINELSVKSYMIITVKYDDIIYGALVLHYVSHYKKFSSNDISLAEAMANQSANIINQAKLYEKMQEQAERERLLRGITETIRNTLDMSKIKQSVVESIGKTLKADRCFLMEYDKKIDRYLIIREEYLSSNNIQPYKGIDLNEHIPNAVALFKQGKRMILNENKFMFDDVNLDIYTSEFMAEFNAMINYQVYSALVFPIFYKDEFLGDLVLHYVDKKHNVGNEEIDFLNLLSSQIAISLYQAKLYAEMQTTATRETILRKIIEITRSSLDPKKVKEQVVNELGRAFKADRCYFRTYDKLQDKFFPPDVEYLSSQDIKSLLNVEPNQEGIKYFSNELRKRVDGFYPVIANIEMAKGTPLEAYMKSSDIKADYAMPIAGSEKGFTWLVLHYSNEDPKFDDDYKKLLETIAFQVDMALNQIKLHNTTKQQAEREKAILSNLPFMVWLKDRNNRFLAVNEPFANTCGMTVDNLIGKTDFDLWPKDLAQSYVDDDLDVIKKGETKSVEELIPGPDGARWHETYKTPLFDETGEIIGTTGFSRDITERKEIDKMKNEFVSTVSHELRTPLTSLSGALELVLGGKMGDFSDKIKGLLNIAHNNCVRLTNLINDILDIEKIEAGKMDFEINTIELMSLISHAIQLNLQYAQKFNVEIKLVETLPNVFVQVDENRLMQVITNLLSNAIKFSEPNSYVELSTFKINDIIRISVTNHGTEIPQEFKNRIFQKFAQADSSDSRKKGGIGLGLSISKLIIEKMNGNINFISENNKTTFYFDLPEFIENQRGSIDEKTCSNM